MEILRKFTLKNGRGLAKSLSIIQRNNIEKNKNL